MRTTSILRHSILELDCHSAVARFFLEIHRSFDYHLRKYYSLFVFDFKILWRPHKKCQISKKIYTTFQLSSCGHRALSPAFFADCTINQIVQCADNSIKWVNYLMDKVGQKRQVETRFFFHAVFHHFSPRIPEADSAAI